MLDDKTRNQPIRVPLDVPDEMGLCPLADGNPEVENQILCAGTGHGSLVDTVTRYCDRHDGAFPEIVALETDEELKEGNSIQ